ncbi:helix-turn-helix domain-containing protein [Croceicoccus naphthovorans]|uniref:helix-turn-helix domain-containing protein n=1 Tax=Croceicoccus naphthovorans TaxID=1348774 RepID=UPI00069DABD1|nr:helix-turn-helix domain-containing protein [Croceicoccus naphthovorans]MBB3990118.1 AraC-like DNA-binding protein [Croceicoccus naphthovorans]
MYRAPHQDWTVADLTSEARMSRSAFASRFSDILHETPAACRLDLRMRRSVELIAKAVSLQQVSKAVGFSAGFGFR